EPNASTLNVVTVVEAGPEQKGHAMTRRRCAIVRTFTLAAAIASVSTMSAQAQIAVQTVASGLSQPLAFVQDPAIANVAYVVEQGGLVKVIQKGQLPAG